MSATTSAVEASLAERIRRVMDLDLEPIKFKVVHDGETGWTIDQVDRAANEYKKFLVLVLKNNLTKQVQSVVPTRQIDLFWHTHILDTAKYAADCEFALGFFLHHFPYLGLRGAADAEELRARFRETQEYYRSEFGVTLGTGDMNAADCDTSDCAPDQSCSGEPDPKIVNASRPVLQRT